MTVFLPKASAVAPIFGTDSSPTTGTTEDSYTFDVAVSDSDGTVTGVTVTWDHGTLGETDAAMNDDGDGTWSYSITLDESTSSMTYTFTATDDASETTTTSTATVTVSDNDNPTFGTDTSPSTGTTGDSYTFDIAVDDNVDVSSVTVTWSHGALGGTGVTMNDDGDDTWSYTVTLAHSTSQMSYTFTATDAATNSASTTTKYVTVTDNDYPSWGTNTSPTTGTTGDSFTFDVGVSDNIGVTSVSVSWSHGSLGGSSVAMTNDGDGTWSKTITLDHSTSSMTYTFTATDAAPNYAGWGPFSVTVTDNDAPTFSNNVLSPTTPTTGDSLSISVDISDNIAVNFNSAALYYRFGSGLYTLYTTYTTVGSTVTFAVTTPSSATNLDYYVTAQDTSGLVGTSTTWTSSVTDNDAPTFSNNVLSPTTPTTGESLSLSVDIADNIGVDWNSVILFYDFTGTGVYSQSTTYTTSAPTVTFTLTVPSSATSLSYYFQAADAVSSTFSTIWSTSVTDNDAPTFSNNVLSPTTPTTGDSLGISVDIADNVAVNFNAVTLYYDFGTGSYTSMTTHTTSGSTVTFTVTVPTSATTLSYYFTAADTTGNLGTSTTWTSSVADNDAPTFSNNVLSPATPTTGESLSLSVDIADNIAVNFNAVTLYYNFGSGYASTTTHTTSAPTVTFTVTVPTSATTLSYYFTAADTTGNLGTSSTWSTSVTDNDRPTFGTDSTPTVGYTGDSFTFRIAVSDNIGVTQVTVEYWYGSGGATNTTMTLSGTYYLTITVQSNSLDTLHYIFHARDARGNWANTVQKDVTIYDNDAPVFGTDSTPTTGYTGDSFTFNIAVTDNIAVTSVTVEYWYSGGSHTTVGMTGPSPYTYSITIQLYSTASLYYVFRAYDAAGNSRTASQRTVTIRDNDAPTFTDNSPTSGTTGDTYTFSVSASDNIAVSSVRAYWSHDSYSGTRTLSNMGGGIYSGSITLDYDSISDMSYYIVVTDTASNMNTGSTMYVTVIDNDVPMVFGDYSATPTTGDPFTFSIYIYDYIDWEEVSEAHILYCYDDDWSSAVNVTLTFEDSTYTWDGDITVQHTLDPITFTVTARDAAGNWMTSTGFYNYPMDNDNPAVTGDTTPTGATTGDLFTFNMTADDNIDVGDVYVSYSYQGGTSNDYIYMSETWPGIWTVDVYIEDTLSPISYFFTVYDTSWNYIESGSKGISITDNDKPMIFSDMSPLTAEAGKEYLFKVMVDDNILVNTVSLEYWFDYAPTHIPVQMDVLSGTIYYYQISLQAKAGTLSYFYSADDSSGNIEGPIPTRTIDVLDIMPPVLGTITFDEEAFTGDTFALTATVTDDVEIEYVRVWYYFGELPDTVPFVEGTKSGNDFSFTIDVPHALDPLWFWVTSSDTSGNLVTSDLFTVNVLDNDDPVFGDHLSSTAATTGDDFTFSMNATDNIGVMLMKVSYKLPGMEDWQTEELFRSDNTYSWTMTLPNDIVGEMVWSFLLMDTSSNEATTEEYSIELLDDEMPIADLIGPSESFQHKELTFSAMGSTDNVAIAAYIWTINGETFYTPSVNYTFADVGTYLIEVLVSDGSNPTVYLNMTVNIRDADDPVVDLVVPELLGNHEMLHADASGSTDNVGITVYSWLLILPGNDRVVGSGPTFDFDLEGVLGTLRLYLTISDAEGNTAQEIREILVIDNLPPVVSAPSDLSLLEGSVHHFADNGSTDNVGIVRWVWTVNGPGGEQVYEGSAFMFFFEEPGTYNITLTVYDSYDNNASDYLIVTVTEKPADYDGDEDGMPDVWEDAHGLDKNKKDQDRDYDSDLITNYNEYLAGTDPKNPDTDGDGLPDKWEMDHGFDPVDTDNSQEDPDDDGATNLEEYLEGNTRDPTVSDSPDEKTDRSGLFLAIVIILAILALIMIVVIVIYLGRVPPVEQEFPEDKYPHLYKNKAPEEKPAEKN